MARGYGFSIPASRVSGENDACQIRHDARGAFSSESAAGCFSGASRVAHAFGPGKGVPAAYNGLAQWLGMAGAFFIAAFVLGIIVTIVLRAGSGVPAAMLLIPTPYLVPTSFVLTEIKSFMQHRAEKRRKARAMRPER